MFKNSKGIKALVALCIIPIILFSAGCSKDNKKDNGTKLQSDKGQKPDEKVPKTLTEIESSVESLFEALGGPTVNTEEGRNESKGNSAKAQEQSAQHVTEQQDTKQQGTEQQDTKQQDTKQQDTKQQGTEQQDTKQQDTEQQDTKQQGTEQQDTKQQGTEQQDTKQQDTEKWVEIDGIISSLHYQWNSFMPEVAKKGADINMVDNFDNALNALTTSAASKDNKKVMASANKLYSHVADLYSLYKTKMSSEEKKMIYYSRNIILESDNENWETVKQDNDKLEKSWALFRNTLNEEQKEIGDKLDFSMYELHKVIEQEDKHLTNLKGEIILSNIKELEKSFEKMK